MCINIYDFVVGVGPDGARFARQAVKKATMCSRSKRGLLASPLRVQAMLAPISEILYLTRPASDCFRTRSAARISILLSPMLMAISFINPKKSRTSSITLSWTGRLPIVHERLVQMFERNTP